MRLARVFGIALICIGICGCFYFEGFLHGDNEAARACSAP